jgi:hypothetical protein
MLIKSPSSVVITNGVKGCRPKSSSSLLVIISLSKPFDLQGFSDNGPDPCLTWQFLFFFGSVDPFQKVVLESKQHGSLAIGYPFYIRSDIFSIYTPSSKSVGFGSGNFIAATPSNAPLGASLRAGGRLPQQSPPPPRRPALS